MKNHLSLLAALTAFALSSFSQSSDSTQKSIGITYSYQHFERGSSDWHITGLEYSSKNQTLTWIARANYAKRFGVTGWQGEAEAYLKLSKKIYAYTGISYSGNMPVFPKWRSGLSLYFSLPLSWEAEGGMRYLFFDKNIFVATAGLSKYLGSWLLNVKGYGSFTNDFNDPSIFFTVRKYLRNEKDYLWLQVGTGISPDENRNVQFITNRLSSKLMIAGMEKTFFKAWKIILSAGYSRDEYVEGQWGNRLYLTTGLRKLF